MGVDVVARYPCPYIFIDGGGETAINIYRENIRQLAAQPVTPAKARGQNQSYSCSRKTGSRLSPDSSMQPDFHL